jgi:hypothetical protein
VTTTGRLNSATDPHLQMRCRYQLMREGIHAFVVTESSPASIDDFFGYTARIYQAAASESPIRILILVPDGVVIPVMYAMKRSREFARMNPRNGQTRVAVLHVPGSVRTLAATILEDFPAEVQKSVCFLSPDEQEKAVRWLVM